MKNGVSAVDIVKFNIYHLFRFSISAAGGAPLSSADHILTTHAIHTAYDIFVHVYCYVRNGNSIGSEIVDVEMYN